MLSINSKVSTLNKIGTVTAKKFSNLGIETVRDLLYHFPFRYDDYSMSMPISALKPGERANIKGVIELIQNKRSPRKRINITEALVSDETATVKIVWFNQPFIARNLKAGDRVSLSGPVDEDFSGPIMKSPEYEKTDSGTGVHTQGLVPIYRSTANLTQKQIRFLAKQAIVVVNQIEDWLPAETKQRLSLVDLPIAMQKIHFPRIQEEADSARRRLSFDELFLMQLKSQIIRKSLENEKSIRVPFLEKETKDFVDSLPFKLTDDQRKTSWEIIQDIGKDRPMSRLLEGDVGSGKTMVAILAMLNIGLNKELAGQATIMVPTEILATQHFNSISKLLAPLGIKVGIITRTDKRLRNGKEETKLKAQDIAFEAEIIIGTHALIQEKVEFRNLLLTIIDEQHRFGVEQRKNLTMKSGDKSTTPHLLSMTATPIPRSLALTIYGDLDISIIREMPVGRKPIITKIVQDNERAKAHDFIREEISKGRQVFVVCPLIDMSDKLGLKSVTEEFAKLDKKIFPDIRIAMLHGRLKPQEKDEIMQDFVANRVKILVATSVVEVGVDIPNATVMMIEGAERFGLAQLHQFRGRVGRGEDQAYCFLFTGNDPSTTSISSVQECSGQAGQVKVQKRLEAMVKFQDGFSLAKIDLELRGAGEVFGTAQKGFPDLRIASLFDYQLVKLASDEVTRILEKDPGLEKFSILREELAKFEREVHLE